MYIYIYTQVKQKRHQQIALIVPKLDICCQCSIYQIGVYGS